MGIILLVVILAAFVAYMFSTEKYIKVIQTTNNDLLNRVMAKDYKEYAAFKQNEMILNKETVAQTIMKDQDVFQVD